MLMLIVLGTALIAILAGLVLKLLGDARGWEARITGREFLLGAPLVLLAVAPLAGWASYRMALLDRSKYQQYVNGYETAADETAVRCTRDGPCRWEYDCDPYVVMVSYECGSSKSPRTCYRPETRYHDCPYVATEYEYSVGTTAGDFTFAAGRFPPDPDAHRWRASEAVPNRVVRSAGVGPTPDWSAVRARLDSGLPGPATRTEWYDNYVLASQLTVLKQWSGEAARLDSLKLLPDPPAGLEGRYASRKFMGVKWGRQGWNERLEYLNSVAGPELRADVRMAVVLDAALPPDEYAFALLAKWQAFPGDFALPKNAVVFVLGTRDGRTVAWARAATGMPLGNEALVAAARTAFTGKPLDVDSVIGFARWDHGKAVHGTGVAERLLFGLGDRQTRFRRVSMKAADPGDEGTGFLYLKGEIRPSKAGWAGVAFGTLLASMVVWVVLMFTDALASAGGFSQFSGSGR